MAEQYLDFDGTFLISETGTYLTFETIPILNVSTTTLSIDSTSSSTNTFEITSNVSWTVSDNQSWLTVSPSSGSNNNTILVTATSTNESFTTPRNATITISGVGVTDKIVTATQSATTPYLEIVGYDNFQLAAEAGDSKTFSVLSNLTWTSIDDDQVYFNTTPSIQTGDGDVTVVTNYDNPSTTTYRSMTITISPYVPSGLPDIYFWVDQVRKPYLTFTPSSLSVGWESGSYSESYTADSNTWWIISANVSWVSWSPVGEKAGNWGAYLQALEDNPSTSARSGILTIQTTNKNISAPLSIDIPFTQAGHP